MNNIIFKKEEKKFCFISGSNVEFINYNDIVTFIRGSHFVYRTYVIVVSKKKIFSYI